MCPPTRLLIVHAAPLARPCPTSVCKALRCPQTFPCITFMGSLATSMGLVVARELCFVGALLRKTVNALPRSAVLACFLLRLAPETLRVRVCFPQPVVGIGLEVEELSRRGLQMSGRSFLRPVTNASFKGILALTVPLGGTRRGLSLLCSYLKEPLDAGLLLRCFGGI